MWRIPEVRGASLQLSAEWDDLYISYESFLKFFSTLRENSELYGQLQVEKVPVGQKMIIVAPSQLTYLISGLHQGWTMADIGVVIRFLANHKYFTVIRRTSDPQDFVFCLSRTGAALRSLSAVMFE